MKRNLVWISLLLALMIPFTTLAEEVPAAEVAAIDLLDGLMFTATVEPAHEWALKAPASGELEAFTVRAGDVFAGGETLFAIEPQVIYAEADGVVADVYVAQGDVADGAMNRYGAVMHIDYTDRYVISGNNGNSRNTVENRDLHVGLPVYLRSMDKEESADGVITQVDGRNFTVKVIGGDLDFTERVNVYRQSDYDDTTKLTEGRLSALAPYSVSAAGTVLSVAVKPGDTVKAGDVLLTYVPDVLAPEMRTAEKATRVTAEADLVVLTVSAQQGGAVQEGQVLATVCYAGDYQLVASAEECDIGRFTVGGTMRVTFEELDMEPVEATIVSIGALGSGGDVSTYPVYLTFDAPQGVLLGMHATVEGGSAE